MGTACDTHTPFDHKLQTSVQSILPVSFNDGSNLYLIAGLESSESLTEKVGRNYYMVNCSVQATCKNIVVDINLAVMFLVYTSVKESNSMTSHTTSPCRYMCKCNTTCMEL